MELLLSYLAYYLYTFSNEIIALMVLVVFIGLRKLFTKYIFAWLLKLTKKTETTLDEKVIQAFEKPISFAIIVLGLYIALQIWPLNGQQAIVVNKIFRILIIFIVTWGFYNLTGSHSSFSEKIKTSLNLDDMLVQFFSKFARFIIVAIGILMIAQELNYDVNGFIAGLGLGGLAFALAAKDAIANIFGGVVLIFEKPFLAGDWIKTSGIEGTVEEITFRSTKIRAFDQSLITVPNSALSNEPITNFSRMGKRRITFYLGLVRSTTAHAVENCVTRIKEMLIKHPDVHPETIFVYFEKFNDSSLDIFLYFFTNTIVWGEYLEVRQDINLKILKILEEEKVTLAYPSQSLYLENYSEDKINSTAKNLI